MFGEDPGGNHFAQCRNMTCDATDSPTLSGKYLQQAFDYCLLFNGPVNQWDVSGVKDTSGTGATMAYMFRYCYAFNQPMDTWDVSGVQSFYQMFKGGHIFNQNINNWAVGTLPDTCLLYTSPSPRDGLLSRMPSSA